MSSGACLNGLLTGNSEILLSDSVEQREANLITATFEPKSCKAVTMVEESKSS